MTRYRKVDPKMWDDDLIVDGDDLLRSLWFLLLTGPAVDVVPGLQIGGVASLAETLRRDPQTVSKPFGELLRNGRIEVDERRRLIRVPNAPKYNPPQNPNQIIGWFRAWQMLPESQLKYNHIESLRTVIVSQDDPGGRLKKAWDSTFGQLDWNRFGTVTPTVSEPLPKPVRIARARLEQEQEQEQEQEREREGSAEGRFGACAPSPPARSRLTPVPESDPILAAAWRDWEAMYQMSKRKYGSYVRTPADSKAMRQVVGSAVAVGDVEAVTRHWFKRYLQDDGHNGFLSEARHPLKHILQSLSTYGTPEFDAARQEAIRCLT